MKRQRGKPSHRELVRAYLQLGNTLTMFDSIRLFGRTRLASRISELRLREHMDILTDMSQGYAIYSLAKSAQTEEKTLAVKVG